MNRAKLLVTILAVALLVIWGCERKVVNEIVYQNNVLPGAEACMECHGDNDLKLVAAQAQWERSKHAEAATSVLNANADEGSCERCHTAEGFLAFISGEPFDSSHYSSIGCFTCHAPHTTGTLALRVTDGVTLGNSVVFNRGDANLCVTCHHSRRNVNTYVADSVKLSSHYGPHYSVQGDMLFGTGGYEYDGYTYENSPHQHVAQNGCIDCHMAPSVGVVLGGHSMNMTGLVEGEESEFLVGCNVQACHDGAIESFDVDGVQTNLELLLDSLGEALFDAGIVDDTHTPIADLIIKSRDSTGALFNFKFVEEDRSDGIHNTEYAMGLLRSSLNFLLYHDPNGAPGAPVAKMIASH
jgi:hypothetical protein